MTFTNSSDRGRDLTRPVSPPTSYLDLTKSEVNRKIAAVPPIGAEPAESYTGQQALWGDVDAAVSQLRETLAFIVADLHAHPETAFEEHRSAGVLARVVEENGVAVERGIGGLDTAFAAEWASPDVVEGTHQPEAHPTVAILAEYDALPEIGHACGHNVIAAAGVGAFLAARQALQAAEIPGRVRLIGTPAEEGHAGKEHLARAGVFDDVDAAVMVHGFGYDIASHVWVGRRSARIRFHGVAAHASAQPFMGRNALDAASLAYQGMGLFRQQMPPSDRLHAVIAEGGTRPSIIPEEACLDIYVRSTATKTLMDLSARVEDIARGAALMTGCGVDIEWDPQPMTLPVRNNETMAARWARSQARRGRTALPAGVIPETLAASTDFGNISHLLPGIHPLIKVSPEDVALHTQEFSRWAASPAAVQAAVDGAAGLAQVTVDVLADAPFRAALRNEFTRETALRVADLLKRERG